METAANFISVTWEIALIIGGGLVLLIALLVLLKSILKGGSIYSGLKKALGIIWRNLP
jgi:hypothetical protein